MSQHSPIPVVIIGGYLGSGKTTLINACLQNGLSNAAIIVNDFGDINIDAALISQYSSDTLELTNGCICCSIGESLADTLFSILDRPRLPELIIIETSGVSDPASVAAFTHMKGLTSAGILVLVDATEATTTSKNPHLCSSFRRQIQSAHVISITKTDIATSEECASVHALIAAIAPHTPVIEATPTSLVDMIDLSVRQLPTPDAVIPSHSLHREHFEFSAPPTHDQLVEHITSLPVNVIRVKGVIELVDSSKVLVQKTGRHTSVTSTTLSPTGLVLLSVPD